MNACGNIGDAIASALSAYLVMFLGWNAPFLVMAALSILGALLCLQINARQRLLTA
jgi:sugar phosphate permease